MLGLRAVSAPEEYFTQGFEGEDYPGDTVRYGHIACQAFEMKLLIFLYDACLER